MSYLDNCSDTSGEFFDIFYINLKFKNFFLICLLISGEMLVKLNLGARKKCRNLVVLERKEIRFENDREKLAKILFLCFFYFLYYSKANR